MVAYIIYSVVDYVIVNTLFLTQEVKIESFFWPLQIKYSRMMMCKHL